MLPRDYVEKISVDSNPISEEEKIKQKWRWELSPGDILDVLDPVHKWYESSIIQVRDDMICVHYCGWTKKWDEWIDRCSERLAKRGTRTSGPDRRGLDDPSVAEALSKWDSRLHMALWCDPVDHSKVLELVQEGCDVNFVPSVELPTVYREVGENTYTLLHFALEHNASRDTIALLLDKKADLTARNRYKQSPIWAVGAFCDDGEIVDMARFLVMRGAFAELATINAQGSTLVAHMENIKRFKVAEFLHIASMQCYRFCGDMILRHLPVTALVSMLLGYLFETNPHHHKLSLPVPLPMSPPPTRARTLSPSMPPIDIGISAISAAAGSRSVIDAVDDSELLPPPATSASSSPTSSALSTPPGPGPGSGTGAASAPGSPGDVNISLKRPRSLSVYTNTMSFPPLHLPEHGLEPFSFSRSLSMSSSQSQSPQSTSMSISMTPPMPTKKYKFDAVHVDEHRSSSPDIVMQV